MAGEQMLSCRKRTANNIHPTARMFTRSKSQLYLHRNRSGRTRFDSFPEVLSAKRSRRVMNEDSSNYAGTNDDLSCLLIKDLRTRRVFSNGLPFTSCFEPNKYEEVPIEDSVQSTPPDIDLFVDTKMVEGNGKPNLEFVTEEQQSIKSDQKKSIMKSFLRPSSRVRLFKAPGSFSFRRLLPYLMDISEENSSSPDQENLKNKWTVTDLTQCNNLVSDNQLNSTFTEESLRDSCKGSQSAHVSISLADEWSKPIVNGGIEKFNILNKTVRDSALDVEAMNIGETDIIHLGIPENVNNLNRSESLVLAENCTYGKDNKDRQCFEAKSPFESEGVYKSDARGTSEVNNQNHAISNLCDGEHKKNLSTAEQKDDENGEVFDLVNKSNEDYALSTPSDDNIPGNREVVDTGDGRSINSVSSKTIASSPRGKLVMNRCSRLMVFRTPGSVSYRRMLPFLMNVAEANSCASRKDHVLEKKIEVNPPSLPLISDYQDINLRSPKGNYSPAEHLRGHYNAIPISEKEASSNEQELDRNPRRKQSLNTQQEQDVRFEDSTSDPDKKLDTASDIMNLGHQNNLPGIPLCLHSTSGSFSTSPPSSSSIEEDCNNPVKVVTNDAEPIRAEILHQETSVHATLFCQNIPAPAFKKGILKRNPRGCRGPCTCLYCSSFHLHAQKAFQFSRNQMQDAEEVASDLIKELSYIRNLLEKSPLTANGHSLVSASQVKEACRRASEAEAMAQNHLNEMNFDLNVHCRVPCTQRPRVRFASHVEEKVIPKSDGSTP